MSTVGQADFGSRLCDSDQVGQSLYMQEDFILVEDIKKKQFTLSHKKKVIIDKDKEWAFLGRRGAVPLCRGFLGTVE